MINGGFYIKARCQQESEIAIAPPHVRELWDWLLKEANYKPIKYAGYEVKRGQCFRSIHDMREGLKWMVGYRTERYSENQMKHSMKWLRSHSMITSTKTPRGNLITICNYDKYQDPKNYECPNERPMVNPIDSPVIPQGVPSINKNDKNEKNERKKEEGFDIFKISDLYQLVEDQFSHISDLSEEDKYTLADGLLKRAKHMKGLNGSFTDSQMDALVFTLKELKEQSVKFIMRSIMNSIQS